MPVSTVTTPSLMAGGEAVRWIPEVLDAVIFDMDGLLLDTEPLYRTAIFASCASQGYNMVDDVHLSLVGTPKELGDAKLMAYFGRGFDLERFHADFGEHIERLCAVRVPLRPGAQGLLSHLRQASVPIGIATSTARPRAEVHLRRAGLFDLIDVLVTRTDVRHGKPDPECYLRAAELLKARPRRCLALEDSHNGVRAAAAAGMATIMIPDQLAPTDEMRALCVGVLPSLVDVQRGLAGIQVTLRP
jgi:HAD superfamily hydrolase (TIGR01509 family)